MKRLWIVALVLMAFAPACKKSATAPTGVTQPTQFVFAATLLPANEVSPAATGPETAGSGTATITLNVVRDGAGTITSATTTFQVNLSGFPSGTSLNAAHIHPGPAGVAGGVLINTTLASGEVVLTAGSGAFTKSNITTPADQAQSIITNPAGFYFNVHTPANPSGVCRGQLSLTSSH